MTEKRETAGSEELVFVALIDVLGFSELVRSGQSTDKLRKYLRVLTRAMKPGESNGIKYIVFSDSIVFTTKDCTEDSFYELARRCSRLMADMLQHGFSIRGAISCGRCIREQVSDGVFLAGPPIVEAYYYEQLQDWVGIMLSPAIHEFVEDLEDRCEFLGFDPFGSPSIRDTVNYRMALFVQKAQIPCHGGDTYEGYAIVPAGPKASLEPGLATMRKCLVSLKRLRDASPNPSAQRKHVRTIAWLETVVKSWIVFQGVKNKMIVPPSGQESTVLQRLKPYKKS